VKKPAPGVVIAGKYRIDTPLSSGGMGSVWVAHHIHLDNKVAIKFLHPELASEEELRMRFVQEAKAAARITSRYAVKVMDFGSEDDVPYMAMELLKGEDLRTRLERCQSLPLPEALRYLTQITEALEEAHEIGIIHRDIKPENIFLVSHREGESVKILDFGIAKWSQDIRTATGIPIGTLGYMSPEQVRGQKDVDARSDLWSLAVVLFEMVAGKPVFGLSGDIDAGIRMILLAPIPRITSVAPELPAALDPFFARALSRDRSQRFPSASELLGAFAQIVQASSPIRPPARQSPAASAQAGATLTAAPGGRVDELAPTRPLWGGAGPQPSPGAERTAEQGATLPLVLVKKAVYNHGNGAAALPDPRAEKTVGTVALPDAAPLRALPKDSGPRDEAANEGRSAAGQAVHMPNKRRRGSGAAVAIIALLAGGAVISIALFLIR
jgi:serine/threonine-protein kinase